jgi:hypothetical protein
MLTKKKRERLLKLARDSIREEFNNKKPEIPKLDIRRGVFVTLKKKGRLRGCVGYINPGLLVRRIYEAAKSSAFSDFRFPKLKEEELEDLEIEISILTNPEECDGDIEIGSDGLICDFEGRRGLLLPQVAEENGFNRGEFLECLCRKAGLDKDKWTDKNFKLEKFQCEIFSEKDF